ncbi:hypothetical protein ACFQL8_20890 [Streptomyces goshikiensis]|uniref:hypothetical protein n=1 Tax=Streptomyces goshikiensis TaxID=1942 RepID=UPI0016756A83|nr:hypothetical protein [Streptomyces goshikiensis]
MKPWNVAEVLGSGVPSALRLWSGGCWMRASGAGSVPVPAVATAAARSYAANQWSEPSA